MPRDVFRTPLGRVRFLGSARQGSAEALHTRLTAIALVPLSIGFVWLVLSLLAKDYNAARAEMGQLLPSIIVLLFVLVGVYHMQLGMRSVIIDYVGGRAREWALYLNALFAGALGVVCVYAALRIGFA